MINKYAFLFCFFSIFFCFGQQNNEFKEVTKFYDYQRLMLNREFKKRFDGQKQNADKLATKQDFEEFMVKLDSIQNRALVNALIRVKIKEDLDNQKIVNKEKAVANPVKEKLTEDAAYPGGFEVMRSQIANLFYTNAILTEHKQIKTNLFFTVERDGTISSVKADGDNFSFNRQAEIALYLLPEKFSPAYIKGEPVRYRFNLPLAMNFE